ncbi:unannotated protein [freshwater metagenome]|uniref:Unannotated protein n=1 Tax=freshwater metagenome TaxID=449393 RepID=A0A6J7DHV5_9ZZZZ
MGEEKGVALLQVRLDGFQVQLLLHGVRGQDHDDVSLGSSRSWVNYPQAGFFSPASSLRTIAEANSNIDARVA